MKKFSENEKLLKKLSFGLESDAVSHNECTGLISFAPVDKEQLKNYSQIQSYSPDDIVTDK